MVLDVVLQPIGGVALEGALRAGTKVAQVIPRIDAVLVAVIPAEADGVVAHRSNLGGAEDGLEHHQRTGVFRARGLIGQAMLLLALVVAQGAWATVAQVGKGVGGLVAVVPDDVHGAAVRLVNLDGCGLQGAHK